MSSGPFITGLGLVTPLAATARYEACPSAAYDPAGTLWVAYEEGGERWGKDWGAYVTSGFALYHGRAVRLRGIDKSGRAVEADPGQALPGIAKPRADADDRQGASTDWETPNPNIVKDRRDSATPLRSPPTRSTSWRSRDPL